MNILDRIKLTIQWLIGSGVADNQENIGKLLGYTNKSAFSQILNGKKPLPESFIDRLCVLNNKLNPDWMLTGEGPMLKSENNNLIINDPKIISIDEGQPILDIRICAGQGIGLFGDENKVLSRVNIPDFKGCVGVIVYGESMYDKYAPGDAVFVREISNCNYIENGQPYVVITKEDRLLKLVYQENDKLTLVSYNTVLNPDGRRTFPDMPINPDDILYIYKVVGKLARNQI